MPTVEHIKYCTQNSSLKSIIPPFYMYKDAADYGVLETEKFHRTQEKNAYIKHEPKTGWEEYKKLFEDCTDYNELLRELVKEQYACSGILYTKEDREAGRIIHTTYHINFMGVDHKKVLGINAMKHAAYFGSIFSMIEQYNSSNVRVSSEPWSGILSHYINDIIHIMHITSTNLAEVRYALEARIKSFYHTCAHECIVHDNAPCKDRIIKAWMNAVNIHFETSSIFKHLHIEEGIWVTSAQSYLMAMSDDQRKYLTQLYQGMHQNDQQEIQYIDAHDQVVADIFHAMNDAQRCVFYDLMGHEESRRRVLEGNYVASITDVAKSARNPYLLSCLVTERGKTRSLADFNASAAISGPCDASILQQKIQAYDGAVSRGTKLWDKKKIYINLRFHSGKSWLPLYYFFPEKLYKDQYALFQAKKEHYAQQGYMICMGVIPFHSRIFWSRFFMPPRLKSIIDVIEMLLSELSHLEKSSHDEILQSVYNDYHELKKLSGKWFPHYGDRERMVIVLHAMVHKLSHYVDIYLDQGCAECKDRGPVIIQMALLDVLKRSRYFSMTLSDQLLLGHMFASVCSEVGDNLNGGFPGLLGSTAVRVAASIIDSSQESSVCPIAFYEEIAAFNVKKC